MPSPPGPPPDAPPGPGDADAPYDPSRGRRLGDPVDEPRVPRGCHPLVFGVVMGTIQFAVTIYFMRSC